MSAAEAERQRLRNLRTPIREVTMSDGSIVYLRQLNAVDSFVLSEIMPEGEGGDDADPQKAIRTGLAVLALSLATKDGERLFTTDTLDEGIALVSNWPPEYIPVLNAALSSLNNIDEMLEGARRD